MHFFLDKKEASFFFLFPLLDASKFFVENSLLPQLVGSSSERLSLLNVIFLVTEIGKNKFERRVARFTYFLAPESHVVTENKTAAKRGKPMSFPT